MRLSLEPTPSLEPLCFASRNPVRDFPDRLGRPGPSGFGGSGSALDYTTAACRPRLAGSAPRSSRADFAESEWTFLELGMGQRDRVFGGTKRPKGCSRKEKKDSGRVENGFQKRKDT